MMMGSIQRKPALLGILIVVLGIIWLFNNLEIFQVNVGKLISTYWPVLLMVWGIDLLSRGLWSGRDSDLEKKSFAGRFFNGLILLGIGAVILGRNLGLYELNLAVFWKVFWPVVLIFIGWSVLRGMTKSGGFHWAVMSGIELKSKGWKLVDSSYLAFMGGIEMDLTVADIPGQETVLNLTAVMGGIDVRVPADLEVECTGTAILGGVKFFHEESGGVFASRRFESRGEPGTKKKLIIKGIAVMGGIEVKH
jgi:hypothetical protein